MNQVLAAFTEENPCIEVVAEPNIGDDQNTRRLTMIASGTAPDLIATEILDSAVCTSRWLHRFDTVHRG